MLQTSDFSVTEVQSEMVAPAESSKQPEPQTSSIEVTDAAPGRSKWENLRTTKHIHLK